MTQFFEKKMYNPGTLFFTDSFSSTLSSLFFLKYCIKDSASWNYKGKTLIVYTGHILSDTLLPSLVEDHIVQELQQVQDIFDDAEKLINQAVTSLVVEITSTTLKPPVHFHSVSAWEAVWGIFVILLIFTPLAGCYIYLVRQGMRGDLDLNWDSLENTPKNQLRLSTNLDSKIDMPSSRKNSMNEQQHPGANIVSGYIRDVPGRLSVNSPSDNDANSSICSLVDLEDL